MTLRSLSSTSSPLGIFSRSAPPADAPPSPQEQQPAEQHLDLPLTPFQTQIAALETETLNEPTSIEAHLALLRALLEGGEYAGLTRYYETLALNTHPDAAGAKVRDVLVKSDEAWGVYTEGLSRMGRLGEIATMVRRRDNVAAGVSTGYASSTPNFIPTAALSTGSAAATAFTASSSSPASSSPASSSAASSPSATQSPLVSSLGSSAQLATAPGAAAAMTGAAGGAAGTPLSPIYVQLAPATPKANAWRAVRWMFGMLFWGFLLLTVFSMVMQSTGLLKAGQGPAEFEPEEGKIVKFSDVHGVEEAKNVSCLVTSYLS